MKNVNNNKSKNETHKHRLVPTETNWAKNKYGLYLRRYIASAKTLIADHLFTILTTITVHRMASLVRANLEFNTR